jgi:hypothetical protein
MDNQDVFNHPEQQWYQNDREKTNAREVGWKEKEDPYNPSIVDIVSVNEETRVEIEQSMP